MNFNLPYPEDMGDEGYFYMVDELLFPVAVEFQPELILISAGFDGHVEDSLTPNCLLTDQAFIYLFKKVSEISKLSQAKVVTCFEGGYGLTSFGNCFLHMVNNLCGWKLPLETIGLTPVPHNYDELVNEGTLQTVKDRVFARKRLSTGTIKLRDM